MIAQKMTIWIQPLAVMSLPSETLWPEKGVDEIDEQSGGHDRRERVVEGHRLSSEPLAEVAVSDRGRKESECARHQD
jgi:hypothetical protein